MGYAIRMGIPEMEELWNSLQKQYKDGFIRMLVPMLVLGTNRQEY